MANKPKKSLIVLVVAAEGPEEFFAVPQSWLPKENLLRDLIYHSASKGKKPLSVEVGEVYLGQRDNKEWFRVRVTKINFNSTYNVYFMDYGRKGIVSELKTCTSVVAEMKPNVFKCSLVDSSQMKQDREHRQYFKYLVSNRLVSRSKLDLLFLSFSIINSDFLQKTIGVDSKGETWR